MERNIKNNLIIHLIQLYWIAMSLFYIYGISGDGNYFSSIGYIILLIIFSSFILKDYHVIGWILLGLSILINIGILLLLGFGSLSSYIIILFCLILILNICSPIYLIRQWDYSIIFNFTAILMFWIIRIRENKDQPLYWRLYSNRTNTTRIWWKRYLCLLKIFSHIYIIQYMWV